MSSKLISSLLVLLMLPLCVGMRQAQGRKRMKREPKRPIERVVMSGVWGGAHVRLEVNDRGATVEYDCAHGSIDEPLTLDSAGRFEARGTFVREGGSIRVGITRPVRPARYEGRVSGRQLRLTVTLTDTSQPAGAFTLTQGSEGQLRKCR
jgi:hypothetical protein